MKRGRLLLEWIAHALLVGFAFATFVFGLFVLLEAASLAEPNGPFSPPVRVAQVVVAGLGGALAFLGMFRSLLGQSSASARCSLAALALWGVWMVVFLGVVAGDEMFVPW